MKLYKFPNIKLFRNFNKDQFGQTLKYPLKYKPLKEFSPQFRDLFVNNFKESQSKIIKNSLISYIDDYRCLENKVFESEVKQETIEYKEVSDIIKAKILNEKKKYEKLPELPKKKLVKLKKLNFEKNMNKYMDSNINLKKIKFLNPINMVNHANKKTKSNLSVTKAKIKFPLNTEPNISFKKKIEKSLNEISFDAEKTLFKSQIKYGFNPYEIKRQSRIFKLKLFHNKK